MKPNHANAHYNLSNVLKELGEYNNDNNSGGLKVYDAIAPEDWNFEEYNKNANKIYKFLNNNNANCTKINYKFNRAVLFNSDYFHET